jgi:hypothetical protein
MILVVQRRLTMADLIPRWRIFFLAAAFSWLLAGCCVTPASAGESFWNHNGSIMQWVGLGDERWVLYLEPRPSLWPAGVQPGTLLFRGRRIGNWMGGTAHTFSARCGSVPYWVEGMVYSDTDVTLMGAAPVQDAISCAVIGYTWQSPNAVLRFVYIASD